MTITSKISTDIILDAYRDGAFPMAENADEEEFFFYKARLRGLLPIKNLHVPKRLAATIKGGKYVVTHNHSFGDVIDGCAQTSVGKRDKTWINRPIRDMFVALYEAGHAHSVECRDANGALLGGIYGLAIGAVFCGESMFSREADASKIALVHLAALLWKHGFTVFDTQFINPHLVQFGAFELPQAAYETLIETEMTKDVTLPQATPETLRLTVMEFLAQRQREPR